MIVHPVPYLHVHQAHSANLVRRPEIIQGFQGFGLRIRSLEPQQLEILCLEHESQRFGKRRIRHSVERIVIDGIQRKCLLDIVSHFMDRNVESLVVHPCLLNPRAQMRLGPRMAAPMACPDPRAGSTTMLFGCEFRALRRKSELLQQSRDIFLKSLQRWDIFLQRSASSSAPEYSILGRNPLYQMSNGSSGRPSRF